MVVIRPLRIAVCVTLAFAAYKLNKAHTARLMREGEEREERWLIRDAKERRERWRQLHLAGVHLPGGAKDDNKEKKMDHDWGDPLAGDAGLMVIAAGGICSPSSAKGLALLSLGDEDSMAFLSSPHAHPRWTVVWFSAMKV
ncbi:hypothetical protein TRIUR3_04244 [Triticum urartu]|uniref:Uncharacterized protein n=1 Tax=Triticum urartu TaxID=4572 RepID=M7Z5L5_TRIUA|nr:hypothetical protein TRIUR3_04244 [Triticum urartu]